MCDCSGWRVASRAWTDVLQHQACRKKQTSKFELKNLVHALQIKDMAVPDYILYSSSVHIYKTRGNFTFFVLFLEELNPMFKPCGVQMTLVLHVTCYPSHDKSR